MSGLTNTYISQNFQAEIKASKADGKKELIYASPKYFRHCINKFKDEEKITVTLTNKKPKRTEQQNRYYWGVYLPLIAEKTGNDEEDLHNLFKGLFLSKGIVRVLGRDVRRVQSSTELSTADFVDYIMKIEKLTGVLAPPTKNYIL